MRDERPNHMTFARLRNLTFLEFESLLKYSTLLRTINSSPRVSSTYNVCTTQNFFRSRAKLFFSRGASLDPLHAATLAPVERVVDPLNGARVLGNAGAGLRPACGPSNQRVPWMIGAYPGIVA
jgi:hypothetical protein